MASPPIPAELQKQLYAQMVLIRRFEEKIVALYSLAYQRQPDPDELSWALDYLKGTPAEGSPLTRLEQYAQTLLVANEFFFVD